MLALTRSHFEADLDWGRSYNTII